MKRFQLLIASFLCISSFQGAYALLFSELENRCQKEQVAALREALEYLQVNEIDKVNFEQLAGGMSDAKLYTFNLNGQDYVLRFLQTKHSQEEHINEIQAHRIGHALGIAPSCIYADKNALLTILPFVRGHTLSSKDLNDSLIDSLGKTIQKLHSYSGEFPKQFTMVQRIQKYYDKGKKEGAAFPTGFENEVAKIANESSPEKLVPCHGDLNPSNILIENDKLLFIDWTTAGLDDPFSDLGCLCLSGANFTKEQEELFLKAYLGRDPTSSDYYRLEKEKAKIALSISTLWFRFAYRKEQVPLEERVARLDALLQSGSFPTVHAFLEKGALPNLKTDPKNEVEACALAFYRYYLEASKK